jgi:hypothetical protein
MKPLEAVHGSRTVERSSEPVMAWRAWRLRRDGRGRLRLQPAFRGSPWEPLVPTRAACVRHRRHDAPKRRCTCGLYGFRDGGEVGLGGTRLAAVGQVALWGRVVEHELGYRAALAYPSRVRLVCSVCLTMGARPAAPTVVAEEAEYLLPLCDDHARSHRGHGALTPASAVESELLSTYAVDLLPIRSLPAAPQEEEAPSGAWSWSRGPGKGVVVLVLASLLLRVVLLWAAMSSGTADPSASTAANADGSSAAGGVVTTNVPPGSEAAVEGPAPSTATTSAHRRLNASPRTTASSGPGGSQSDSRDAGNRGRGLRAAGAGAAAGTAAGTSLAAAGG